MASRYWVGGSANWDAATTTNWSTSSGGAGGASVPTSADDVFIDGNSGSSPTVTITATANCLSLNLTGAITPTLAGSATLNIFGSVTLISTLTTTFTGTFNYAATATGKTITSAGINFSGSFTFNGVGGGWTLQDALVAIVNITLTNGSLNTNGKNISCSSFSSTNANVRSLTLGSSSISVAVTWNFTTTTNLTFSAGTSTITMTGNNQFFRGGGATYNALVFSATISNISSSSTFATLTILAGKTLKLTASTTQTVTSLICNGTTALPSTLQSDTAGSAATIALPAGRYFIRHTSIKDITISGATTTTSIAGTDVSGNTGITFVTKFEIGRIKNDGSFNWYSSATGTVTKVSG